MKIKVDNILLNNLQEEIGSMISGLSLACGGFQLRGDRQGDYRLWHVCRTNSDNRDGPFNYNCVYNKKKYLFYLNTPLTSFQHTHLYFFLL